MTHLDFIERLKSVLNHKTLYVLGCCGAPLNAANKKRYISAQEYNARDVRKDKINAADSSTFGFDCVCLIKSILWGWNGDNTKTYGGAAVYSNNVPDINADQMIKECSQVSTDFSSITPGEAVWMPGHIGVYIGNNQVIECTPIWDDGVQISSIRSNNAKNRNWRKHGKLPWIDYTIPEDSDESFSLMDKASAYLEKESLALTRNVWAAVDVISGKYGVGTARKEALNKAGFKYEDVQQIVNELMKG